MKRLIFVCCCIFTLLGCNGATPAEASIFISEILADPPAGLAGDANHDGNRSASADEFVEIFNSGGIAVNLSGWMISDQTSVRHTFPAATIIGANQYLVVFGGGSPFLPGINWQTASTGSFGFNNGGDTVSLFDDHNQLIDQVIYGSEGGQNQSLVRVPTEPTAAFVLHTNVPEAQGRAFSPGEGFPEENQSAAAVPEPATLLYLALGYGGLVLRRSKKL